MYWGQPHLWPFHNIFLHLDLSQASSLESPFSLISSFNTSLQLFLGLPFTPSPSTCNVSILFIQHNSSLLSTWLNHLNLFCHITSAMSSIASMLLTHTHYFYFHLNSLLSSISTSSFHSSAFSLYPLSLLVMSHCHTTLQVLCMLYR